LVRARDPDLHRRDVAGRARPSPRRRAAARAAAPHVRPRPTSRAARRRRLLARDACVRLRLGRVGVGASEALRRHARPRALSLRLDAPGGRSRGRARPHLPPGGRQRVCARGAARAGGWRGPAAGAGACGLRRDARARAPRLRRAPLPPARAGRRARRRPHREDGHEFNAAVFLEPAARGPLAFETYRKASLFPLTERVPVAFESEWLRRRLPWLGTWRAGAGARVVALALPGGRKLNIAPLICYDVLDPRLALGAARRGAELIVTLSNDSWFAAGPGPRLHLVGAAFLSIETRRPQLRATNTGISAVIAPTGEVLDALGVDQRGTLVATVRPEIRATTLMVAWGDWFGPSALGAGLVLLAAAVARHPRLEEAGRGR